MPWRCKCEFKQERPLEGPCPNCRNMGDRRPVGKTKHGDPVVSRDPTYDLEKGEFY